MGLFDSMKKKGAKPQTNSSLDNPMRFYTNCVESFHNEAKKNGYANRGLIFIPELISMGEKAILAFLQDPYFNMECHGDAGKFYYLIMSLSIQTGVVFAEKWHTDFDGLKNGYVDEIIADGPALMASAIMQTDLDIKTQQEQNEYYQKIYAKWIEMHEPYWKLADPRQYIFKAMTAAFQLGVSMILEKYGY